MSCIFCLSLFATLIHRAVDTCSNLSFAIGVPLKSYMTGYIDMLPSLQTPCLRYHI